MAALKNFSIYTFGTLAQMATSIFLLPIYLKYLPTSEYGVVSVLLVTCDIISVITNFGTLSGFYILFFDLPLQKIFTTSLFWRIGTILPIFCFSIFQAGQISILLFKTDIFYLSVIFAGAYCLSHPLVEMLFMTLRLQQRAKSYVMYSMITAFLGFVLKIFFIAYLQKGVLGFWVAHFLTDITTAVPLLLSFRLKDVFGRPNWSMMKQILKLGFPYNFSTLGSWLVDSSGNLFLNFYAGSDTVGIYAMAMRIAALFKTVTITPLGLWWPPYALAKIKEEGVENYKVKSQKLMDALVAGGFLGMLMMSLVGLIINLLPGHPEYKKAIPLIAFCLIPQYFLLLQYVFGVHFIQTKELKYVSRGGVITAFISLLGNACFIYYWDIPGAIISNTVTQGGLLAYYYISGQKVLPIDYHYRLIMANGMIYLIYLVVLLMAVFFIQDSYLSIWVITSLITGVILLIVNYKLPRLFGGKISNLIKRTFRRRTEKCVSEALP